MTAHPARSMLSPRLSHCPALDSRRPMLEIFPKKTIDMRYNLWHSLPYCPDFHGRLSVQAYPFAGWKSRGRPSFR